MPNLKNTLLFQACRNYNDANDRIEIRGTSTAVPAMVDNDYTTSSSEDDVDVNVADAEGNATAVDAVFVKYAGDLTSYVFTPLGGSGSSFTRMVPDEVDNYAGDAISLEVDGFKHDLYLLASDVTATSVRLQFTGTDVEIYEVMLLELLQEIDANASEFLASDPRTVDRTGRVETSPVGRVRRVRGSGREKRDLEWTVKVVPGETLIEDIDEFLFMLEANTRLVLAESFSEDPSLLYPAVLSSTRISVRYLTDYKPHGYAMNLSMREA